MPSTSDHQTELEETIEKLKLTLQEAKYEKFQLVFFFY
jgi:hypothetical protein